MPTHTVVREYHNNPCHVVVVRSPADELQLALNRYERLSSTPKWMTVPYVSNIDGCERSRDHAIDTGNEARAKELQRWLDEEWRRRECLAQWTGQHGFLSLSSDGIVEPYLYLTKREQRDPWKGRTLDAWRELLSRMWQARSNAVAAGALDPTSQVYVQISDRIRDVEHRVRLAKRREARGEPAIA